MSLTGVVDHHSGRLSSLSVHLGEENAAVFLFVTEEVLTVRRRFNFSTSLRRVSISVNKALQAAARGCISVCGGIKLYRRFK